jgi:hypothetical protein
VTVFHTCTLFRFFLCRKPQKRKAPLIEKFLHTFIFLSYEILCIVSDMYSAPYKCISSSTFILHCLLFWKKEITLFVFFANYYMIFFVVYLSICFHFIFNRKLPFEKYSKTLCTRRDGLLL